MIFLFTPKFSGMAAQSTGSEAIYFGENFGVGIQVKLAEVFKH